MQWVGVEDEDEDDEDDNVEVIHHREVDCTPPAALFKEAGHETAGVSADALTLLSSQQQGQGQAGGPAAAASDAVAAVRGSGGSGCSGSGRTTGSGGSGECEMIAAACGTDATRHTATVGAGAANETSFSAAAAGASTGAHAPLTTENGMGASLRRFTLDASNAALLLKTGSVRVLTVTEEQFGPTSSSGGGGGGGSAINTTEDIMTALLDLPSRRGNRAFIAAATAATSQRIVGTTARQLPMQQQQLQHLHVAAAAEAKGPMETAAASPPSRTATSRGVVVAATAAGEQGTGSESTVSSTADIATHMPDHTQYVLERASRGVDAEGSDATMRSSSVLVFAVAGEQQQRGATSAAAGATGGSNNGNGVDDRSDADTAPPSFTAAELIAAAEASRLQRKLANEDLSAVAAAIEQAHQLQVSQQQASHSHRNGGGGGSWLPPALAAMKRGSSSKLNITPVTPTPQRSAAAVTAATAMVVGSTPRLASAVSEKPFSASLKRSLTSDGVFIVSGGGALGPPLSSTPTTATSSAAGGSRREVIVASAESGNTPPGGSLFSRTLAAFSHIGTSSSALTRDISAAPAPLSGNGGGGGPLPSPASQNSLTPTAFSTTPPGGADRHSSTSRYSTADGSGSVKNLLAARGGGGTAGAASSSQPLKSILKHSSGAAGSFTYSSNHRIPTVSPSQPLPQQSLVTTTTTTTTTEVSIYALPADAGMDNASARGNRNTTAAVVDKCAPTDALSNSSSIEHVVRVHA